MRKAMTSLQAFAAVLFLLCATSLIGQTVMQVPRVIHYSGTMRQVDGRPRTGTLGVTFAIYADDQTTVPMWQDVQTVVVDETGHYSVLLGASRAEGLPEALFANNQARWLGIRVENEREQPRVLLAAVPYALKAADAETLGGMPLSAFVLNASANSNDTGASTSSGTNGSGSLGKLRPLAINATGSGGTQNFVAKWTDNAGTLGNSMIQDTGTQVGIGKSPAFATLDVSGGGAFTGQLRVMGFNVPTSGAGLEEYYDGNAGHIFAYDRDLNVEHDLAFGTNNEVYIKNGSLGVAKIPSLGQLDVNGSASLTGPLVFNGGVGVINTAGGGNTVLQVSGTSVFYADGGTGNAVVNSGHSLVVPNGNIGTTGTVTASLFNGSGASLTSVPAGVLTGTVPSTAISGTYSNAVTLSNVSNNYFGNGSNLAAVNATTVAGVSSSVLNRRLITYLGGCDSCSVLTAADNQMLIYQNLLGAPLTFQSITCYSDAGTPNINLQRDNGSQANVTSSPIGCSASGTTVSSFSVTSLAANEKLNFLMTTPDGVAHRVTVIIATTL